MAKLKARPAIYSWGAKGRIPKPILEEGPKNITPAPVRMPVCKGHKMHDSIADIEMRKPKSQLRRALGQLRCRS